MVMITQTLDLNSLRFRFNVHSLRLVKIIRILKIELESTDRIGWICIILTSVTADSPFRSLLECGCWSRWLFYQRHCKNLPFSWLDKSGNTGWEYRLPRQQHGQIHELQKTLQERESHKSLKTNVFFLLYSGQCQEYIGTLKISWPVSGVCRYPAGSLTPPC